MAKRNIRRYAPTFKAKVAIEAAKERESLAQLGQRFSVHPVMVGDWKKQLLERGELVFARESREQLANYKRFRALTTEWVGLSLERARLQRAAGR